MTTTIIYEYKTCKDMQKGNVLHYFLLLLHIMTIS